MTVCIEFAKKAKTFEVLESTVSKADAMIIAQKHAGAAFGVMHGIMKAMGRTKFPIVVKQYTLRYLPFWNIHGESFYEYKRSASYSFPVKPEVQKITIGHHTIKIDPKSGQCAFDATDHCFEHYTKEIVQDACHDKGKDFAPYLTTTSRSIKSIDDLHKKGYDVPAVQIRASYLLNKLYAEIIKPIQADEVLDERIVVTRLALCFAPMHVFEVAQEGNPNVKHIVVDAITGTWEKSSGLLINTAHKYWNADTAFDITGEVISNFIPGAGVAAILTKKVIDRRVESKESRKRQDFSSAFGKKRLK